MKRYDESGFSLIELVIVVVVLGIVMGAIGASLIAVITTTGATATRVSQSHDAQLLSTYLVPDLQSAARPPASPDAAPPSAFQVGDCPGTSQRIGYFELSWTDAASGTLYRARYEVDTTRFVLTRTFTAGTAAPTSIVVAHNLEDPTILPVGTAKYPACYLSADGKTTVTINTLVNRDSGNSSQYSFDVSAQTRTPFRPTTLTSAPLPPVMLTSLVSEDIAPQNGKVDTIVATFNQPLACTGSPSCDRTKWTVTNQPGGGAGTPTAVVTSANTVAITLTETALIDTAATGMKVALAAGSVLGSGGNASFAATDVADSMPPLLSEARFKDADADGKIDAIALTFSEVLDVAPRKQDYSLANAPAGTTISDPSPAPDPDPIVVAGRVHTLPVTESTAVDTVAAGMRIRIAGGAGTAGVDGSLPADLPVEEGIPPVLDPAMPPIARDLDGDGRVDQVVVSFNEDLAPYTAPISGVWTLVNVPSGATLASVSNTGTRQVTLTFSGGGPADTATAGFTIELNAHPDGVRDARGNQSSFTATPVEDGMAPSLVTVFTPIGTASPNPNAGKIEPGDTLDVTFSEPLAALPTGVLMGVEDGVTSAGTIFTLPGLVSEVVVGPTSRYTTTTLSCSMLVSNPSPKVVRLVVETCLGDLTAIGDTATARIDPAVRDAAGNAPSVTPPPVNLPSTLYF